MCDCCIGCENVVVVRPPVAVHQPHEHTAMVATGTKARAWSTAAIVRMLLCRNIKERDYKSILTIPYPRPNGRHYLGETKPHSTTLLKPSLLHMYQGEAKALFETLNSSNHPGPTAHDVVPGLASRFRLFYLLPQHTFTPHTKQNPITTSIIRSWTFPGGSFRGPSGLPVRADAAEAKSDRPCARAFHPGHGRGRDGGQARP